MPKVTDPNEVAHEVSFHYEAKDHYGDWDITLSTYGDGTLVMYAYGVVEDSAVGYKHHLDFEDVEIETHPFTLDALQKELVDLLEAESERQYDLYMERLAEGPWTRW